MNSHKYNKYFGKALFLSLVLGTSLMSANSVEARAYTSLTINSTAAGGVVGVYWDPNAGTTNPTTGRPTGANVTENVNFTDVQTGTHTATNLIINLSNAQLDLVNAVATNITINAGQTGNNITLSGQACNITGTANGNTINVPGTVHTAYGISNAGDVRVNAGSEVGNISSTINTVAVSGGSTAVNINISNNVSVAGSTTDNITNTTNTVTVTSGSHTKNIDTSKNVTVEASETGDITNTENAVNITSGSKTGKIENSKTVSVAGSTTGNIFNTANAVTISSNSTTGDIINNANAATIITISGNSTTGIITNADKVTVSGGSTTAGVGGIGDNVAQEAVSYTASTVNSAGIGILNTTGGVNLSSSHITGATGGVHNTNGNLTLTGTTYVTATNSGDAINGVTGNINIDGAIIKADNTGADTNTNTTGNGIVAGATHAGTTKIEDTTVNAYVNGIDLSTTTNTKDVTITNTTVKAITGDGINTEGHNKVVIDGLNVTAGLTGVKLKGNDNSLITTVVNHTINAGTSGISVDGANSKLKLNGANPLEINIANTPAPYQDALVNGGILASNGVAVNAADLQIASTITLGNDAYASGILATSGATIEYKNAANAIKTAAGAVDVNGVAATGTGSKATMETGTIELTGTNDVNGVAALNGGEANVSNLNSALKVNGGNTATGVYGNAGTAKLDNTALEVTTADGTATGVKAEGTNGVATMTGGSTGGNIQVTGTGTGTATGVLAQNAGTAKLDNADLTVTTANGVATGLQAEGANSAATMTSGSAGGNVQVTVTGDGTATGVLAQNAGTVNKLGGSVAVTGTGIATGVLAQNAGTATLDNADLTVTAANGAAIGLQAEGANSVATMTSGSAGGNVQVTATGDGTATGVLAQNAGTVNKLGGSVAVTAATGTATGILADGSIANVEDLESLTATSTGGDAAAFALSNEGTINAKNIKTTIDMQGNNKYAVLAQDKAGALNLTNIKLNGDIKYDNGTSIAADTLKVNVDKDSVLTSKANVVNAGASQGSIIVDNAGTFNVVGDSNFNKDNTNSALTNTGLLDMTADGHANSVISVANFTNNAETRMDLTVGNAVPTAVHADQILTNTVKGNGSIRVNQLDKEGSHYQQKIDTPLIVADDAANSDGTMNVVNDGTNRFETGSWSYQVQASVNANNQKEYNLVSYDLSNKAKAANASMVNPDIWYLETNALYEQVSNYNAERADQDVWAYAVHSKMKQSDVVSHEQAGSIVDVDVNTKYNGIAVGWDTKVNDNDKATTYVGIMGGYGDGSLEYVGGETDLKSIYAGVYGVYKTKSADPFYVSGILKYNRYNQDIKTATGGGVYSDGDVSQNAYGLSLLAGKRFNKDNGFYVEPQLEVGFNKANSASYSLGNMDVELDGSTSLRARGGVALGKRYSLANEKAVDLFLKASLVHEFDGKADLKLYGEKFESDYGGTWGQYKLGLNYANGRNNNINFALTMDKGGKRSSDLGFQLGANWSF